MGKVAKFEAYPLILHCIHLKSAHGAEECIHGRVLLAVFRRASLKHPYKEFAACLAFLCGTISCCIKIVCVTSPFPKH